MTFKFTENMQKESREVVFCRYSLLIVKNKKHHPYYDESLKKIYTENIDYSEEFSRNDSIIELLNYRS